MVNRFLRFVLIAISFVVLLPVLLVTYIYFDYVKLDEFRNLTCDVVTEIPDRRWKSSYKIVFADFYLYPRGTMTTPDGATIKFSCDLPAGRGGNVIVCERKLSNGSERFWMQIETSKWPKSSINGGMPETNEQFDSINCATGR